MHTFQIERDRTEIYIMPGVVNCFSCTLDIMGSVAWQVDRDFEFVPVSVSPDAEADGNFLVIAMPDNYVLPGTSGRQTIACISLVNLQTLEARLSSPGKNMNSATL